MVKVALFVKLEAKPGKEKKLADFLEGAFPLALAEPDTISWYAFQINSSTFGIFDTFFHDEGRKAHLTGKIAEALMANASELLNQPPVIEEMNILAAKQPIQAKQWH